MSVLDNKRVVLVLKSVQKYNAINECDRQYGEYTNV